MLSCTFAVVLDSHPLDVQVARHKPQGIIFLLNTSFKPTRTCEREERKEGGGERGRREEGEEARRGEDEGGWKEGGVASRHKSMYITIHLPLPLSILHSTTATAITLTTQSAIKLSS